jgi:Zn-dependent peptidase ImmA (M78 family)
VSSKQTLLRLMPDGWNERVFDESDFYRLCHLDGVRVLEDAEMPLPGAYCVYDKIPVIFIARRLRGAERLRVQFHELGHHWLHYPHVQFFLNLNNRLEFEANIVAACALIPFPLLRSHDVWRLEEEYGYSKKLIAFRVMLFQQLSI